MDDGDEDGLISMMTVVILLVMMAIMKALSLLEYSNNFYSKRGKDTGRKANILLRNK